MAQFIFGERDAGKKQALQQYHKNLKSAVRRASYRVSVTCNEKTRQQYDEAIENLIAFENSSDFKTFVEAEVKNK